MKNPKFDRLLDQMKEIHDRKNSDYANDIDPYSNFSFAASFSNTEKLNVYLTLIGVKAARLIELLSKNKTPKNESINDTLLDFATYSALMASDLMVEKVEQDTLTFPGGRSFQICLICGLVITDNQETVRVGNGTVENPYQKIHKYCDPSAAASYTPNPKSNPKL